MDARATSARSSMDAARGALANTARTLPLPLAARHEVSSFLELFQGVPASTAVLKELCKQPLSEPELCVRELTADTRVCLQWSTERRRCAANIVWQQWTKADAAPWSVDLTYALVTEVQAHRRQVVLAAHSADANPTGLLDTIDWAKRTWKAAVLGPCPNCETAATKRLRLECSQLCCRCTLQRAIAA